jgi:hypothetical protein
MDWEVGGRPERREQPREVRIPRRRTEECLVGERVKPGRRMELESVEKEPKNQERLRFPIPASSFLIFRLSARTSLAVSLYEAG